MLGKLAFLGLVVSIPMWMVGLQSSNYHLTTASIFITLAAVTVLVAIGLVRSMTR